MSLYKHRDYRSALLEIIEQRKSLPAKLTLRSLAEKSGLQASFLTNVLKGRLHFSADQLYALADELSLKAQDREYLLLLLEEERCYYPARKAELEKRIAESRRDGRKSEKHLDVQTVAANASEQARYFLDPFAPLVLTHLGLSPYDRQPEKLAVALGLAPQHLSEILKSLVAAGDVAIDGARYKVMAKSRHLPKTSPLALPHLALMRLKAVDQLQRLGADQAYSHSVTFTGTEETMEQLSEAYLTFLKKAEAIVKPAASEKVFQMNFDLFPWIAKGIR